MANAQQNAGTNNANDNRTLALEVAGWLENKKARHVMVLDVRGKTVITDFFVIASGLSHVTVTALCDEVDRQLAQRGMHPRTEGYREARWVVLDLGGVLVHIFKEEDRDFYRLERLWHTGENELPTSGLQNPN